MANVINLNAEIGANYIGDDAQPAIRLENSSTGPGLSVDDLHVSSLATIQSSALTQPALTIGRTTSGNASVGVIAIGASGPSVPVIQLLGRAFTSAVSIVFAASANWAGVGGIRVQLSDGITYGWIPVLPSATFTGAAE